MLYLTEQGFLQTLTKNSLQKNPLINAALEIARKAHEKDIRDNGCDYLQWHIYPIVGSIIDRYKNQPELETLVVVAILHDVLENSDLTCEYLAKKIDRRVADIVCGITKPKDDNHDFQTQEEKYEVNRKFVETIKCAPIEAIIVKLEDRLQNMQSTTEEILHKKIEKYRRYVRECKDLYLPLARKVKNHIDYSKLFEMEIDRLSKSLENLQII